MTAETFEITELFDDPFYTAQRALADAVGPRWHVAIGGHRYMTDVTKYTRRTLPTQRDMFDLGDEPDEGLFNPEAYWTRSQTWWDYGAGQRVFDEEEASARRFSDEERSLRRRFWDSKGIDPWDDQGSVALHHDTTLVDTPPADITHLFTGYTTADVETIFAVAGSQLRWTTTPAGAWNTSTTPGPVTILDYATNGTKIWLATASGVCQVTVDSPTIGGFWSTQPTQRLAYVNGRLIGSNNSDIFELDSAGTPVTTWTHPSAGSWTAFGPTEVGLFASFEDSSGFTTFHGLTVDATTAIAAPVLAGHLPRGEQAFTMEAYGSVMLIGTSQGLRTAEYGTAISNLPSLEIGPSVRVLNPVRATYAEAQFVWFGWENFDATSTGLGRADLSATVRLDSLLPPHASDLMATAQGVVAAVTKFNDKLYFSVDGSGLYEEADNLVPSGWVDSGAIRFGVHDPKIYTSLFVGHDPLVGTITGTVVDENGSQFTIGSSTAAGTIVTKYFEVDVRSAEINLILTLTRDGTDPTTGPRVRWWNLHGIPAPKRVTEIVVALVLRPNLRLLDNTVHIGLKPLEEFEFLTSLADSGLTVNYQEGSRIERVRVDQVAIVQSDQLQGMELHSDRPWWQGVVHVRMLSREV